MERKAELIRNIDKESSESSDVALAESAAADRQDRGAVPDSNGANRAADREARVRRRDRRNGAYALDAASPASGNSVANVAAEDAAGPDRDERRARQRPRAPRAERRSVSQPERAIASADQAAVEAPDPAIAVPLPETLHADAKGRTGPRVAARARKRQQAAAAALDQVSDDPAIGALNRHLNMMMHQLTTAHRVIGRVAAERDALRQQLADLQGIPVEEIVVSTIGATTETATRASTPAEKPASESRFAKFNYFGGDDIALVRKRRQSFVLGLIAIGIVLALVAQQLHWSIPTDVSRDSLSALPILGNLMTLFLAGWLIYRVVRISSKGVRWVFPTEDRRRRRR